MTSTEAEPADRIHPVRIAAQVLLESRRIFADTDRVIIGSGIDGSVYFQLYSGTEARAAEIAKKMHLEFGWAAYGDVDVHINYSGPRMVRVAGQHFDTTLRVVVLVPIEVYCADHVDDFASLPEQGPFYSAPQGPTEAEYDAAVLANRYLDAYEITVERSRTAGIIAEAGQQERTVLDQSVTMIESERTEQAAAACEAVLSAE